MKIVIAAGGRFHAIRLAQELYRRKCLYRLISGSYTKNDEELLPPSAVTSITSNKIIDQFIWRTRLASVINPSTLYVFKDSWFDSRLAKVIQNLDPFDIFVGWAHYFLGSLSAIRTKCRIIIAESGSCHIDEQEDLIRGEYRKLNLPINHIHDANRTKILREYQASDFITTPSTFARTSFLKRGFPPDKILQIPCGMDVEFFSKTHTEKETIKQVNRPCFRLLFVGQLQVGKGIHTLLQAWEKLKLPVQASELLLVGNMQRDIKMLLKQTGIPRGVRIIPGVSRKDLKIIYASADAFVLPSIQDGFGMVLGEAMASGLPVIASMNTGAPDIITHGVHGLLVPAGNVDTLAQAILMLYQNRDMRIFMGTAGARHIKKFSWQHYGDLASSTYQNLLDTHEKQKAEYSFSGQI